MHEFEQVKSCAKRPVDIWTNYLYYFFSIRFVYFIRNSNISPNALTISSVLLALVGSVGFMTGIKLYVLFGLFAVQLSYVLDCADGQLARYKQQFSPFGGWLDQIADRVKEFAIYFSLAFGYSRVHPEQSEIWGWAMSALFFVYLLEYLGQIGKHYFSNTKKIVADLPGMDKEPVANKKTFLEKVKSVRRRIPFHAFNIGEQYISLLFFILFQQTYWFFVFVTLMGMAMSIYRPTIQFLKLRNPSLREV